VNRKCGSAPTFSPTFSLERSLERPNRQGSLSRKKTPGTKPKARTKSRDGWPPCERRGNRGETDFEAWEDAIRDAVLRLGANLLEGLLADAGCGRRKEPLFAANGQSMHSIGVPRKPPPPCSGRAPCAVPTSKIKRARGIALSSGFTQAMASGGAGGRDGLRTTGATQRENGESASQNQENG